MALYKYSCFPFIMYVSVSFHRLYILRAQRVWTCILPSEHPCRLKFFLATFDHGVLMWHPGCCGIQLRKHCGKKYKRHYTDYSNSAGGTNGCLNHGPAIDWPGGRLFLRAWLCVLRKLCDSVISYFVRKTGSWTVRNSTQNAPNLTISISPLGRRTPLSTPYPLAA